MTKTPLLSRGETRFFGLEFNGLLEILEAKNWKVSKVMVFQLSKNLLPSP
jgi:hypothetical protein